MQTQRFRNGTLLERLTQSDRTRRGKNVVNAVGKNVTERNRTVSVEATRNNASVAKHAYLVAQTVAGVSVVLSGGLFGGGVRPFKAFPPLEKDFTLGQTVAAVDFLPFTRIMLPS